MGNSHEIGSLLYFLVGLICAILVYRDCRKMDEAPFWNVSGAFLFWPLFYLVGWLWIWPGALRRGVLGMGEIGGESRRKRLLRRTRPETR